MRDQWFESASDIDSIIKPFKYNISIFCFPLCLSDSLSMFFSNIFCVAKQSLQSWCALFSFVEWHQGVCKAFYVKILEEGSGTHTKKESWVASWVKSACKHVIHTDMTWIIQQMRCFLSLSFQLQWWKSRVFYTHIWIDLPAWASPKD